MSETAQETLSLFAQEELPFAIDLELSVKDRETIQALAKFPAGPPRDEYALEALKIGVLALRQASGALDTDFIQRETSRLVDSLRTQLDEHTRRSQDRLTGSLKEYFDPDDGRFSERVKHLVSDDGELAKLLQRLMDGDDSRLAKTLLSHVGENSPLMKLLSPDQSEGLLAALRSNVEGQLTLQRDRILREFSLDNPESALHRLVGEITSKHGDFTKDMRGKLDEVIKEFSLDEENSALSRLVSNVDSAQKKITQEFSLDNKQSALHKLKAELFTVLSDQVETNAKFQEEVKIALGKLVTKRETEAKGTQHGFSFEDALFEFLSCDAQARGDIAENTSNHPGLKPHCKKGDVVLQLGSESTAAGARIVVEAKQDSSYTLAKALTELEEAIQNRGAQLGIFVFSRLSAPEKLEPLRRYGNSLIVIWDAEDSATDSYLRASLEIARALCVRAQQSTNQKAADFTGMDKAMLKIEKAVENLDTIRTSAKTILNSGEKILKRVDIDQQSLEKQLATLRDSVGDLKQMLGSEQDSSSSSPSAS